MVSTKMRKLFFVNREMCGGREGSSQFELDDFCEVLQGKLGDFEVLPSEGFSHLTNRDDQVIEPRPLEEALGEYLPQ